MDYINRAEIEKLAEELSTQGKLTMYTGSDEFSKISFATKLLLLSDVFIISLVKKKIITDEKAQELLNKLNTQAQELEREHRQHCDFCRREIETINKTNDLRVLLNKLLNSGELEKAFKVSIELNDLYASGIANSHTFKVLYDRAVEKKENET